MYRASLKRRRQTIDTRCNGQGVQGIRNQPSESNYRLVSLVFKGFHMKTILAVLLFCSVTSSYASDLWERSRAAQVLVSEEAVQKLSRADLVKLMASVEKVAMLLPSPGNTGAYLTLERELARRDQKPQKYAANTKP
jgi:hypothetical protein